MYRCVDCEAIFEEPKMVNEYRGEFWGTPAYEEMAYCPFCNGDIEVYEEPTGYWVSGSTATGELFGDVFEEAANSDELFKMFHEKYPECEIADYGSYTEVK